MTRYLALTAVGLCAFALSAQQSSDLDSKLSGKIAAALTQSGAPGVSVAIVEHGKLAYTKAFGQANIAEIARLTSIPGMRSAPSANNSRQRRFFSSRNRESCRSMTKSRSTSGPHARR